MSKEYGNGGVIGDKLSITSSNKYGTITYVGSYYQAIPGTTSPVTIPLTSLRGTAERRPRKGDMVVVVYGTSSTANRNIGIDSNYNYILLANEYSNDSFDANMSVNYKIMGDIPDIDIIVSGTGSTADSGAVALHVWRNINPSPTVSITTSTGIDSRRPIPPSITPSLPGSLIVFCGVAAHQSANANADSYLEDNVNNPRDFFQYILSSNSTNRCTVSMAAYQKWISGSFTPGVFSSSQTSATDSWCAATIVFNPTTDISNLTNSGIWDINAIYDSKL
jgi:hypothetical protein